MIRCRAKLRHVSQEATRVGELGCSAVQVILFQEELDEAGVFLRRSVDIFSVQERRGQASMRDEVLGIDRNGRPQERSRRDPVVLARKQRRATAQRIDFYIARDLARVRYRHQAPRASPPPDAAASLDPDQGRGIGVGQRPFPRV